MVRRARTPLESKDAPLLLVGRWSQGSPYAHMLAHHFIEGTAPGAPLWFHEGFARYLAHFAPPEDRKGPLVCFGLRPAGHWEQITPPLEELLTLSWEAYNDKAGLWAGPNGMGLHPLPPAW